MNIVSILKKFYLNLINDNVTYTLFEFNKW